MFPLIQIGTARTPFAEKVDAPRQATAARDVAGTIEILPAYEHALADLDGIERIWVLFWFHLTDGEWRAKVLPPRSDARRGVLATRSPHRPNPIGLSCVRLERVDGLTLHVRDVDLVDGTPVVDIKPYIPYADAFPDARTGWLEAKDPIPPFAVRWSARADAQRAFLAARGVELAARVEAILALGPQPHPYRRIRADGDALRLAVKEWRVRFRVDPSAPRAIEVLSVHTGYRQSQLYSAEGARDAALDAHRAFLEAFG